MKLFGFFAAFAAARDFSGYSEQLRKVLSGADGLPDDLGKILSGADSLPGDLSDIINNFDIGEVSFFLTILSFIGFSDDGQSC